MLDKVFLVVFGIGLLLMGSVGLKTGKVWFSFGVSFDDWTIERKELGWIYWLVILSYLIGGIGCLVWAFFVL